jgi:hypothetical protein
VTTSKSKLRISAGRLGAAITFQAGRMLEKHHFEQLPVEPARGAARSRRGRGAARGRDNRSTSRAGNRDRPGRSGLGSVLALEQQHRGFDRERGQARRRRPRAGRCRSAPRRAAAFRALRGARAGAHQIERGDRLDDEIRDAASAAAAARPPTSNTGIATITGGVPAEPLGQCIEGRKIRFARRIDIDDHDGRTAGIELAHLAGERADCEAELDLAVHSECRTHQALEVGVAALGNDARLGRLGISPCEHQCYFDAGCSSTGSYLTDEVLLPASGFTLSVR